MKNDPKTHARITAMMDQRSAKLRDSAGNTRVSDLDLFVLVNLAFVGIQDLLVHGVTDTPGLHAAALDKQRRVREAILRTLTAEGVTAKNAGINLAASGVAVIRDRYPFVSIDQEAADGI